MSHILCGEVVCGLGRSPFVKNPIDAHMSRASSQTTLLHGLLKQPAGECGLGRGHTRQLID